MSGLDAIVDTNVFVSARNPSEPGYGASRKLLDRIDRGEFRTALSTVTIAELRAGFSPEEVRTVWKPMLRHFLTSPNYHVVPVGPEIAEEAGALRSTAKVTLPDCLIIATGHVLGIGFLVSHDKELARSQRLLSVKAPGELR